MDKGRVHRFLQSEQSVAPETITSNLLGSPQLETNPALLIPKARRALERYGHQVVVGNELNRRKFEVVFVTRPTGIPSTTNQSMPGSLSESGFYEQWVRIDPEEASAPYHPKEIEEDIVDELVRQHQLYIDISRPPSPHA